jgi:3-phenylpropionate/trans-cinnamate dioxygenase ferredoxin reductase component
VDNRTFVIVGAGLAGAKAAEELRSQGFDGRVVLVGEELDLPYERPPLSKDFLRGQMPEDKVFVHPAGFYDGQGIEVVPALRAVELDAGDHVVRFSTGEQLHYDRLLLATGAAPRRLPVAGADLEGVRYLRTLDDARILGKELHAAERLVVIGGGWIGSEVAASARQLGVAVTIVDPAPVLLERVLGPDIGAFYTSVHERHGVELRLGAGVEAVTGGSRVEAVHTTDGTTLPADLVVVGIGVNPRTEMAEGAGLDVDNGVVVDELLQTSVADVFAAGDVANAFHPVLGRHLRVEHWANAKHQGAAAAANMLGAGVSYERTPYFFSDQYDIGMEYRGHGEGAARTVVEGDLDAGQFIAYWLDESDAVLAAMNVNVWDVGDDLEAKVRGRERLVAASGGPGSAAVGRG